MITGMLGKGGGDTGIPGVKTMSPASVADYMPGGVSYAGGGYTGDAPRSGGLDGQGGFMAMLHPQETVVDHTQAMSNYGPNMGGRWWRGRCSGQHQLHRPSSEFQRAGISAGVSCSRLD